MTAYYNENDPDCVAWLRELIEQKLIPDGVVDDRSIVDVMPEDLHGFTQKHFFAGVGGWALGCRLAGWPDSRPIETVSCPCQPLSCAGAQQGELDIRHPWPEYHRIKRQLEPCETFGEQVASPLGIEWCDGISLDLEELGYDVAAFDLPAASVGAPHIRQRLHWMANPDHERCARVNPLLRSEATGRFAGDLLEIARRGEASGVADANEPTCQQGCALNGGCTDGSGAGQKPGPCGGRGAGRLGRPHDQGLQGRGLRSVGDAGQWSAWSPSPSFVSCADGKTRRVEPSAFPLVDGIPSRVGPLLTALRGLGGGAIKAARLNRITRLHAYGNAIVPELAAQFIGSYLDLGLGGLTPITDIED